MWLAASWHSAPFLRIIVPFLGGMACGPLITCSGTSLVACSFGLLIILFTFSCGVFRTGYSWRWVPGSIINVLFVVLGLLRFQERQISSSKNWVGHQLKPNLLLIVFPEAISVPGKKSDKITFCIAGAISPGSPHPKNVRGKLLIFTPKGLGKQFIPGEYWLIPAKNLRPIRPNHNPGGFDFAIYCARQHIFHQAFLPKNAFLKLSGLKPKWLPYILAQGQLSAIKAIRKSIAKDNQGLALALLIGYRGETDKELLQAYSNTGVVHVIAVSGMHLGLLFFLLQKIWIFPGHKQKLLRWLKVTLVLLIIWWFSGIAGFSPSITRAALMFTLMTASKQFRKPLDPFQSICFTACFLLWFEPNWLFDAGFQLSFAAILGILCYQPIIRNWLHFTNRLLKELWNLSATTLSAQLLTLPISIFLFHQAPVYFLFANLVAIPLSSIALITTLLQWTLNAAGLSITLPGKITDLLLTWLNQVILHFNRLPGAAITQIEWNGAQALLCYIFLISTCWWLIRRKARTFLISVVSLVIFGGVQNLKSLSSQQQRIVLVLHIPGKQQSAFILGNKMLYFNPPENIPGQVLMALLRHFSIQSTKTIQLRFFRNDRFSLALPRAPSETKYLLSLNPAYLLIPPGTKELETLYPLVSIGTVLIIDGSTPEKIALKWSRQLSEKNICFFNTWNAGAFQVSINK